MERTSKNRIRSRSSEVEQNKARIMVYKVYIWYICDDAVLHYFETSKNLALASCRCRAPNDYFPRYAQTALLLKLGLEKAPFLFCQ
jgi:hypothetical protein